MNGETMNQLAKRLAMIRKEHNLTQNEVAEKLNVSFQTVSWWERGETSPDIAKLPEIAKLYNVTTDWLLMGDEESVIMDYDGHLSDRLFNEDRMYIYIKTYATLKGLHQTVKVLPYARTLHDGQFRKGEEKVPYIYHPLLIACHALSLELDEDDLISAALLHDVCEDCNVLVEELPVNKEVKEIVALLTKDTTEFGKTEKAKEKYYSEIMNNPRAVMIKLLDRCNNVSGMAAGFSRKKMIAYIKETEKWFYPMLQEAKTRYPEYSNQIFVVKYHMMSVIETIKQLVSSDLH